jgi:dihydropteroate synthase
VLSKLATDFKAEPPSDGVQLWHAGRFSFAVGAESAPVVMGIVNVTPDSFSDGGRYADSTAAIAHAEQMSHDGAQILDVGGESTRPGSPAVDLDTELSRVLPVISALAKRGHCVSIDTKKPQVMRAAIDAGASIVNDVYALRAEGALECCAASDVGIVLMHMQGEPGTMQQAPQYADVLREVGTFLIERAQACESAGIAQRRIAIDPGFGFGKTVDHNLQLTRQLQWLTNIGYPVVAGWSRKSTLGAITGRAAANERIAASIAAALVCIERGARLVRVHDVRETVDAVKVWRVFTS